MASDENRSKMTALFEPRSIAVVGASSRRRSATGNEVIRNIQGSSNPVTLWVVNPTSGAIEGIEAVPSVGDLPRVDMAVIAVPPAAVADVVEEFEAANCPAVIVLSIGMDSASQQRLTAVHRRGATHVHGPNCMGIINTASDLHVWANEGNLAVLPNGHVSLISQSGSAAIFVARSIAGVGFSKIISTGNEAGATTADYLSILAEDPDTWAIGIIVESIGDADAFAISAQKVRERGKAIVALKVGRSESGAAATTAHTGALLSSDAAYMSLFAKLGIPPVADYDELASSLELLACKRQLTLGGKRVGVVSISGGQAALCADLAAEVGVDTPRFQRLDAEAVGGTFARCRDQ